MSAVAISDHRRVERVVNQLVAALQREFPQIRAEVTYDPPGGVSAWVTLHGAADEEELEQVRHYGHKITIPVLEKEGIAILLLSED